MGTEAMLIGISAAVLAAGWVWALDLSRSTALPLATPVAPDPTPTRPSA